MQIVSVVGDATRSRVTTSGAVYDVTPKELALVRRIDPATNTVNPRLVGRMVFKEDIGPLRAVRLHQARMAGLKPGTAYRFAVRATVLDKDGASWIWGGVGTFSTPQR